MRLLFEKLVPSLLFFPLHFLNKIENFLRRVLNNYFFSTSHNIPFRQKYKTKTILQNFLPRLLDFFAEREDGGNGQSEMLQTPGDADEGDAENQPAPQMEEGDLPPATQDPQKVHHDSQASLLLRTAYQFVPEGPQGISAKLEQLNSEGNADKGKTHQQTGEVIKDGNDNPAQNKPKDVSNSFHSAIS